jgi:hypothetical protein
MCQVVNVRNIDKTDADVVYIGRGSVWGNPFSHKKGTKADIIVESVADAIIRYRIYLWKQIRLGIITIEMLKDLDGKRLACYCSPNPCHGNVIKRAVQWAKEQK